MGFHKEQLIEQELDIEISTIREWALRNSLIKKVGTCGTSINNYLLSMGRLAVHQFIMEKYITPFTFTDLKL